MDKIVVSRRNFSLIRKRMLKLSLKYVAACCGLSPSTVRNAEKNPNVKRSTIITLMEFYVTALQERMKLAEGIAYVQQRSQCL